jgi:dTDP-4-dehydrorhamnose 3,5-epimerase-like enzyme
MKIKVVKHPRFITKDEEGQENGFLVPIYNVHDKVFPKGEEPQQVYLTSVKPATVKGPHLHFVRRGYFTCIKGNVRVVLKVEGKYQEYFSGEDHDYNSIEVPTGVPAAVQCLGEEEALMLNMPYPAWTPSQNDEHTDDFGDFDFNAFSS